MRMFSIENHIFETGSQVFKKKFTFCFKNYVILAEKNPQQLRFGYDALISMSSYSLSLMSIAENIFDTTVSRKFHNVFYLK